MPRTPSANSRDKSAPKPPPPVARYSWYRPQTLFLLAICVAVIVLYPYARNWLPDPEALPDYRVPARDIHVSTPNRWVPQDLVTQVVRHAALPEHLSLLDGDLVARLAAAFAEHPWVARVVSVRASRDAGIVVDLEYRAPVLMVETTRGAYPVDLAGVLLPPADFSAAEVGRFPHLRNVRTQPAGPAGVPWGDIVVLGGARLANTVAPGQDLTRYWDRFQLEAIEAPHPGQAHADLADLTYELLTRGGSRIVWGRPPGSDDLEPPPSQKLARLEQYLSRYGSFDAPHGPYRIDIRHFEVIEVGSLPDAAAPRGR
jgi:hypothetical protein